MALKPKKPTAYAFIDSQNLNLGTQRMGWKLDWRKFRNYLRNSYGVTKAYMFIGYMSGNESLYEYMHELGFLVVLKPTLDITAFAESGRDQNTVRRGEETEKEKPLVKGNVDVELVLYALKEMTNYQKAIIVSGDGDFFSLAEYLEEQGRLGYILAPNWQYSSLLKPFEKKIVRLDLLRKQLAYQDRNRGKQKDTAQKTK
jgi:uncharacterized LabA/DUF88 family protein